MPGQVQLWILALHVLGVLVWVGTLLSLTGVLSAHARAEDGDEAFARLEKRMGLVMDIGAAIAVAAGAVYLVGTRHLGEQWALKQGWMHVKLLLALILLGLHGFVRVRIGKATRGDPRPLPAISHTLLGLIVLAIVALAVVRPF